MRLHKACSIALAAVPALSLHAQGLGSERRDVKNITGDIWGVWTSPLRATGRDVAIAGGAALGVALTSFADSVLWRWMVTHPHAFPLRVLEPIREDFPIHLYELGSGQYILPASAAAYIAGRLSHSVALRDAGLGCAAGHLSSLGFRTVVLAGVARTRPRVTPEPFHISFPGSSNWDNQSFFSGHISNSMACASFLNHRFSLGWGAIVPYSYSAAIGLGRMADGRHWLSDTMTGAVVGFAIGRTIAIRQRHRLAP